MNESRSKPFTDCHFHVFDAGIAVPSARYVPRYDAHLGAWQQAASAVGVSRGVLVQPSFLGTDNSRLLAELQAHPENLRGVAVVDPVSDLTVLQPLHQAGIRALRLNLVGISHDMSAWKSAHALWDAMTQLGWHLEVHTDAGAVPGILDQIPSALPVVLDHLAKPLSLKPNDPTLLSVVHRAKTSAVHIKLSGAYRQAISDAPAVAKLWLTELGSQCLLWGSDWPCTNHEALANYTNLYEQWLSALGASNLEAAACENPHRVYWLGR